MDEHNAPRSADEGLIRIAMEVCAKKALPDSEMLRTSHFKQLRKGVDVPQERIAEASKGFIALTKLLLPPQTVLQFAREELKKNPLLFPEKSEIPRLVPCWVPTNPLPDRPTVEQRKQSPIPFSHVEIQEAMDLAERCPEIPVSVIVTQDLLGRFIARLRQYIALQSETVAKSLADFQRHWEHASNFLPFMHTALSVTLGREEEPETALLSMEQADVERAFALLKDCAAFDNTVYSQGFSGRKERGVSCPAQVFLDEGVIRGGLLMHVIGHTRSLRDRKRQGHLDALAAAFASRRNEAFANLAATLRVVFEKGGQPAYDATFASQKMKE